MASSTTEAEQVREGVDNLVRNCLAADKGETVLLLNERGGVDSDLVSMMEEAIKGVGADAYSLWVDRFDVGISELPELVGSAIVAADKLVMNCNLNRVVLLDYLKSHDRVELIRINNRTRTPQRIATEHARFDWRLVMELARKVEEVTSAASRWEIETAHGTHMSGNVISGSDVADAFFAQDAEQSRTERVFPGEVYSPVGCADANGVIAFDHPGVADKDLFHTPILLTVKDNMVTDVEWREEVERPQERDLPANTIWTRDQFVRQLEAHAEEYGHDRAYVVDSWHGGMHPKAIKQRGQLSETSTMHFHIGRISDTMSAYMSDQTIALDGKPFWENGRPALLDDPGIRAMAAEYGLDVE